MNLNSYVEVIKTLKEKTVKKAGEETLAVWTPAKRFNLQGFVATLSAEAVLILKDEAAVIGEYLLPAKTAVQITYPKQGYLSTATGNKLNLEVTAECKVTLTTFGVEDVS